MGTFAANSSSSCSIFGWLCKLLLSGSVGVVSAGISDFTEWLLFGREDDLGVDMSKAPESSGFCQIMLAIGDLWLCEELRSC